MWSDFVTLSVYIWDNFLWILVSIACFVLQLSNFYYMWVEFFTFFIICEVTKFIFPTRLPRYVELHRLLFSEIIMKTAFFFEQLCVFLWKRVILRDFKGLPENKSSKNTDVIKDLAIVFESSYVALLACQFSFLWRK